MKQLTKPPKVVILGGSYAGLMAASRLARQGVARVTLIDRSPYFEQRIRLHQVLAGAPVARGNLSQWLAPANVDFVAATVRELVPQRQRVVTDIGPVDYDFLIVALGSQIARQGIPGASEHSQCLVSHVQCEGLAKDIAALAEQNGRLLLVGGGLTQIETAAELAEKFPALRITVACSGNPFAAFAPAVEQYFRKHFQGAGITLLETCTVQSMLPGWCETNKGRLAFDLCLCAPGFEASPLLGALSDGLDAKGRAQVTPALQALHHDRIFIAGDSAACPWPGPVALRMGCAVALPLGAQAGENVAALIQDKAPAAFDFGFISRCVSLGRRAGVVQFTRWDDTAKALALTGMSGAWLKERVCQMTFHVPRWELRTGLRLYRWPSAVPSLAMAQAALPDSSKG